MKSVIALAAAAAATSAVTAGVVWDETIDGDLSNNGLTPSDGGILSLGSNTVLGSTGPGTGINGQPGYDVLKITIANGQLLSQVLLTSYEPAGVGNTSGFVFFDGDQGTGSANDFLGGGSYGTGNIGNDILVGNGIGALGPGTYTFEVREFGGPRSTWSVDFIVTPTPSSLALLGLGAVAFGRRRR